MAKVDDLKTLLANKYGKKTEDLSGNTPLSNVVGADKKLALYLKDEFDVELSASELEKADTIDALANLL